MPSGFYIRKPENEAKRIAAAKAGKRKPWEGKHRDLETRIKISITKTGVKLSERHKKAISNALLGKNLKNGNTGKSAAHKWITTFYGLPKICEMCGKTGLNGHQIHWANKEHTYKRIRQDWLRLCPKCHATFDKGKRGKFRNLIKNNVS